MARTNGCPFSIRNWQIDIQSRASTPENPVWIRIKGLTEMALSLESETQDAADADSLFSERFKTRLSVKLNLEGKPWATRPRARWTRARPCSPSTP